MAIILKHMNARNRNRLIRAATLLLMAAVMGCASTSPRADSPGTASPAHESLNSVLWVQSSVEYAALAEQAYRQAEGMLEEALGDPSWTASIEQAREGDYGALPPAVVLDVDETVLDNSAYQARLILDRESYNTDTWNDWAREAAATAVPGALEFTRKADQRGITVIYLTNRRDVVEDPTRRNLENLGFPLAGETDVILSRGEIEEWSASDKTTRREFIADRYRILLLVGDNLGDFMALEDDAPDERARAAEPYRDHWGTKWIMLPNPQYGSWEEAVIDYDFSAPAGVRLTRKLEALDPHR